MRKLIACQLIALALLFAIAPLALAQEKAKPADKKEETEKPPMIIKAFPPELSTQFTDAQKDIQLATAQLQAAQERAKSVLLNVGLELGLTKPERNTCTTLYTPNGTWVFQCPPESAAEVPKPKPKS